jgi:ribosomal-protein-alanine acetyltransferase
MEVVPFTPEHLDRVVALEQDVYAGRDPWTRAAFEHELHAPASLWLVAVDGDTVAGYAGGWMLAGNEYHVLNLAVAPAVQRQGVAQALMTALLARAAGQGCRSATLEVRRGNDAARALYEKLGFRLEGVRKGYYTDGEDAMIYTAEHLP